MSKVLKFGANLKYTIIIHKLLKRPGDRVKKQEVILQYKFTWTKRVGDPLKGEEWNEEQTTITDWESPVEGEVVRWMIREGMSVERDMEFVDIKEDCSHTIQFAGLCAMCGKDMTETSWVSRTADTDRAGISMIHDHTDLKFSEIEATGIEEKRQRRLLKQRRLTLVVDLDQTVIHACIEPTIGEWQRDPTSPNYDAVKDVVAFQLHEDVSHGLASRAWYYIKMRPGLKEFLSNAAELYELHVYTMGTRAYAMAIAKIIDPDQRLFGDRIISRDENGSMTAKKLERLFPYYKNMVLIIDDRSDVWPEDRRNLIKVHRYDFFVGIGDINSSFLPKREEIPKDVWPVKAIQVTSEASTAENAVAGSATDEAIGQNERTVGISANTSRISALESLAQVGGDGQALLEEQSAEQENLLEKQIIERPLAHLQEQLDQEGTKEESVKAEADTQNGAHAKPHPHHRHNLLKDDDVELKYLGQHLSRVHKAFYDQYDNALISAHGGRVAQLKPGKTKKIPLNDAADLKIVPDVGDVYPAIKSRVLRGTVLVMSGLVPLPADVLRAEIALQAQSFGAVIERDLSRRTTHLITPNSRTRTSKVRQAASRYPNIKIVTHQWLLDTISKWEQQDSTPYLVEIHESDRKSAPMSPHESDESAADEDSTADEEDNDDLASIFASQETEQDPDGLMPEALASGTSPIQENFDWESVDDELKEFMTSDTDDGNDSDASSSTTDTTRGVRGTKRNHGEITDDDEGDERDVDSPSTSAKKQRISNNRSTALKHAETLAKEASLPTPGGIEDADINDDLNAALEAAFAEPEETTGAEE
ncbi:FCP1-like phosphatase-like protein [Calycina marina]|uniref:RNA polymerase II subunit A C-terminal domain phosphatase n=1 Tax=Calycina marina TaxID=1763456 RepID=A0A9P7YZ68_9HELO|nr:FCP1-like phosphatase-like protein [Calycina marina]